MKRLAEITIVAAVLSACMAGPSLAAKEQPVQAMTGQPSPSAVLGRLQAAIEERVPQRYRESLADSFRFTPVAAVAAAHPEVPWRRWGVDQEFEFIRWMCAPTRTVEFHLLDDVLDRGIQSRGKCEWEIIYTLLVDGEAFRGRAVLNFVEIRKLWYLESWTDTRPEPWEGRIVPTSGVARATLTP